MNLEIEIIKKYIDLDSYSSSPGFLGYCEGKCKSYIEDSLRVIFILNANFNLMSENSFIVSSLHFDKNVLCKYVDISKKKYKKKYNERYKKYYKKLLNKNIAIEGDFSSPDNNYDSPEYELKIKTLRETFFCIKNPILESIRSSFFVIMTLGGLDGHIFLLLKDESLIIYPHDDFGVGFIAYGDSMPELKPELKTRLKTMFENDPNIVMHVWDKEKQAYI